MKSTSPLPLLSQVPTVCVQKWQLGQCKACLRSEQESLGKYDLLNRAMPNKKLLILSQNHCLCENNHYSSENNKPTMCLPLLQSFKIGCLTDVRSACYYRATRSSWACQKSSFQVKCLHKETNTPRGNFDIAIIASLPVTDDLESLRSPGSNQF